MWLVGWRLVGRIFWLARICICWLAIFFLAQFFSWQRFVLLFYTSVGWLKACWQDFLVGKMCFFLFYNYWLAEGLLAGSRLVRIISSFLYISWLAEDWFARFFGWQGSFLLFYTYIHVVVGWRLVGRQETGEGSWGNVRSTNLPNTPHIMTNTIIIIAKMIIIMWMMMMVKYLDSVLKCSPFQLKLTFITFRCVLISPHEILPKLCFS